VEERLKLATKGMLRRTRQASQTAGKAVDAEDDPMTRTKGLSRKLLLDRIHSYQSSSALTLDTSSASTNKEDSSNSPTLDPLDNIDPIPTVDLNDARRRKRHSEGCLKIKSQEESSGMFFGSSHSSGSKSVSWCMVEFQTYDIILGDNPATSRGPPLSIGNVISRSVLPLADYEQHRPPRRAMSDLIIPYDARERLLMDAGYSRSDIRAVEEKLFRIKLARRANAKETVFEKARHLWNKRNARMIAANRLSVDRA
jgi:hypothetical protein